jgi:poly [ADP-ribose] polymerase
MGKQVKLLMVTQQNNNKYYDMVDNGDGTLTVTYGRVDVTAINKTYPSYKWDSIYSQKLKKGYRDVTDMHLIPVSNGEVKPVVGNSIGARLLARLQSFAKQSIAMNYKVSSESVTQQQVDEAQDVIEELAQLIIDLENSARDWYPQYRSEINEALLDLYHIIPRRMQKVQDHLSETKSEAKQIVDLEQKNLDVMAHQVKKNVLDTDEIVEPDPILTIRNATGEELQMIKNLMGYTNRKIVNAYRVTNSDTQDIFDNDLSVAGITGRKTSSFWHGSRNENWLPILHNGLLIRPAGVVTTGAAYGHGIYFADEFDKSMGYTSIHGSRWAYGNQNSAFLAVYKVRVGKQYKVGWGDRFTSMFNKRTIKDKGYDSVFADSTNSPLVNSEYIVYDSAQCTIEYLVEVR